MLPFVISFVYSHDSTKSNRVWYHYFNQNIIKRLLLINFLLIHSILTILLFIKNIDPLIILGFVIFVLFLLLIQTRNLLFSINNQHHKKSIDPSFWLPLYFFELKSFFRKSPIHLIILLLAIFMVYFHILSLFIFAMFFVDAITKSFEVHECKELFKAQFKKTSLKQKLIHYALIIAAGFLIPVIIIAIFHPKVLYIALYFSLFSLLNSLLVILHKFVFYHGTIRVQPLSITQGVSYLISALSLVGAAIQIKKMYYQSLQNIKKYVGN